MYQALLPPFCLFTTFASDFYLGKMFLRKIITFTLILMTACIFCSCRKTEDEYRTTNDIYRTNYYWTSEAVMADIRQRDSLRRKLEAELDDPNSKLDARGRMEHMAALVKINRRSYNYVQAMEYCSQGGQLAIKEDDKEMNAFFDYNIGQMLFDVEEYSAGSHIRNSYYSIRDIKEPRVMKACGQYGLMSFEFSFQLMYYDTIEETLKDVLDHFKQSYEADPSIWTVEEYDSLCGTAYIDLARYYARMDQHEKGQEYYNLYLATDYARTDDGLYHEIVYLDRDGQYEKGLRRYAILEEHADTVDAEYHTITVAIPRMRYLKVRLLTGLQRWKECCEAYDKYEDARHYWTKRSSSFKMLEAYERYGVGREKALSSDVKRVANERFIAIAVLAVLLVATIVLCLILNRMRRIISKKNKVLATHISQQLDNKKDKRDKDDNGTKNHLEEKATPKKPDEKENSESVNQFTEKIASERIYLQPDFNPNTVLDEMHLSRRTFVPLFEDCTGSSIAQYIQTLRLEFAADMIRNNKDYTIDAISQESGFSSRATFYRNFTKKYGITPTEYREQCQSAN